MQKVLLFGGTGLVGSRILELLRDKFEFIAPTHEQVNLEDFEQIKENISQVKPDKILYAAGFTNVDEAETEVERCYLLNSKSVEFIVNQANLIKIPVYYFSTDYVFDGQKSDSAYTEDDSPNPLSVYAKSKREGEIKTLAASNKNCVVRVIMPYRVFYERKLDLARSVLERLKKGEKVFGVVDQNVNPLFTDDLAFGIGQLLEKKASGIYHLGARNFTTPFKFILSIAKKFSLDKDLIVPMKFSEFALTRRAKRPQHSWLDTSKFVREFGDDILHSVEEGIELFKKQLINLLQ